MWSLVGFFLKKDLQNYKCILWSTVYALHWVCNVYKYLFCIITTRYVLRSDKPFLNVISLFLGVCIVYMYLQKVWHWVTTTVTYKRTSALQHDSSFTINTIARLCVNVRKWLLNCNIRESSEWLTSNATVPPYLQSKTRHKLYYNVRLCTTTMKSCFVI